MPQLGHCTNVAKPACNRDTNLCVAGNQLCTPDGSGEPANDGPAGASAIVEAVGPGSVLEDLPADMGPILRSLITCPHCAAAREEPMPTDACVYFYECTACREVLRPKRGDCCVFCSFGTVPCPPVQLSGTCCADGRTDGE